MDHAGAFLEAILETPDDDAPRLIFADWLDDAGQPDRAEFIRLQIERARLHPAAARVRAILRREAELRSQHELTWVGPIPRLAARWRFHRGFIEEVSLSIQLFLDYGEELFRSAPIRRVRFQDVGALPGLLQLFPDNVERLADLLSRVRVLDFNRAYLTEPAGLALLRLPKLPRLEGLHLANNALTAAGVDALADSPVLSTVTTLEFTSASPTRETLEILLRSRHLRQLQHLLLARTTTHGDRVVSILHDPRVYLPRLRTLALGHTSLSADGLGELVTAPQASRLESLELSFNPLGPAGARQLARAPHLKRLTWLNLSRTGLGDEGAKILASAELFPQLLGIDLSLDRVGDDGGRALAECPAPAFPETLDLIYNPLGSETREALVERFGEDRCLFTR